VLHEAVDRAAVPGGGLIVERGSNPHGGLGGLTAGQPGGQDEQYARPEGRGSETRGVGCFGSCVDCWQFT
jgi:hypothetical protein